MRIAHHHGKLTQVEKDGVIIKREQFLFALVNEEISFVEQVDDDDHFLYQNLMPVSKMDLITKYNGKLPEHLCGPNLKCTCGSDGVILLDGPHKDKAICRSYITTGYHQTSHTIKDGKMQLNKKAQSERMANSDEIINQNLIYKPKL